MTQTRAAEILHKYGPQVHILDNAFLLTHLAHLCEAKTVQPVINQLVNTLYQHLVAVVLNQEFPRITQSIQTRMAAVSDYGVWTGDIIDPATHAVTANILRAGSLPSQICFDNMNTILNPSGVRQDHVLMSRIVDSAGHVTGAHLGDSKIGGDVDDAIVLFPDPMGATGGSLAEVIRHYKAKIPGKAKKYITLNLITTPEYLHRMLHQHPDVIIYSLRLDRGGSPADVMSEIPGARWFEEIGLTDKQYIIPGGGGFGELINNSYC